MSKKIYILKYSCERDMSLVIDDKGKETFYNDRPLEILNTWCLENGCTTSGRMEAFQLITNTRQKPAVLISERTQDIFFPTASKNNDDCVWINQKYILKIKAVDTDRTEIQFHSGYKLILPLNRRIIQNQISRCEEFISKLNHRIGE